MSYRKVKRHIKKANANGLSILFYPNTKDSSIYFDIGENRAGNGWEEFTSDMLTKRGCQIADTWIKKNKITGTKKRDMLRIFYSLDETYQMEGKVVH